jgi:hypothetical protein
MGTLRAILGTVALLAIPVVAWLVFATALLLIVTLVTWRVPAFLDSY